MTENLPVLHHMCIKNNLEKSCNCVRTIRKTPSDQNKSGGSDRNAQQAQDNQEDCSGKTGKGTDDDGYPVIPDIGFSRVLHEMKEIHDEQGDKTNDGIYYQLPDIPDDIECYRQEDDNDQDENCNAKKCHR